MKRKNKILLISYGTALVLVLNLALWACHIGADGYRGRLDVHTSRAFSEAYQAVEHLDNSLKRLSFASDAPMENAVCTEIYSDAQRVETAFAVLPVELDALEQISKHISMVGDYAFALSRAAAAGTQIPEDAKTLLSDLAETTSGLCDALGGIRQSLSDGAVKTERYDRITDALNDLEQETETTADTLDAELHILAGNFQAVPAWAYDGRYSDHGIEIPRGLEGTAEVSEQQAKESAATFLDCEVDALESLDKVGGIIPCWRFQLAQNGETTIAVTVQGGNVLRVLASEQNKAAEDENMVIQFLSSRGYEAMRQLHGVYVPVQEDVFILPDAVSVTLAEDGSVLRFDAADYWMHHRERDVSVFRQMNHFECAVPEDTVISDTKQVILLSPGGQERFCAELTCTAKDGTSCVIDYNIETGRQERLTLSEESNF